MDAPRIIARVVEIVASPKGPKRSVPDGLLLEFGWLIGKPTLPQDGLSDPYVARRRQSNLHPDPWSGPNQGTALSMVQSSNEHLAGSAVATAIVGLPMQQRPVRFGRAFHEPACGWFKKFPLCI
jgi:hypothetical protein